MSDDSGLDSEEKIQALQLISERRRISFDLLKAHFGSSAKATKVISWLEMDGFINKPEGSERWEILYDKIEKHLADQGVSMDKSQDDELDEQCNTDYQPDNANRDNKSEWEFKTFNDKDYDKDPACRILEKIGLFIICPILIPFMPFMIYDDYKSGNKSDAIFFSVVFCVIVLLVMGFIISLNKGK